LGFDPESVPEEEESEPFDQAEYHRKFLVYCQAYRGLLQLAQKNEEGIFSALDEWGGFKGMAEFVKSVSYDPTTKILNEIEANLTMDNYKGLFSSLSDLVIPHVKTTEEFFREKKMTDIPKKLEQTLSKMVETNNRNDKNAPLTVPLLFWSLEADSYELMIKKSISWPLRMFLTSVLFWSRGKDIIPFVPNYRNSWNI
jgi:hypothetical protein